MRRNWRCHKQCSSYHNNHELKLFKVLYLGNNNIPVIDQVIQSAVLSIRFASACFENRALWFFNSSYNLFLIILSRVLVPFIKLSVLNAIARIVQIITLKSIVSTSSFTEWQYLSLPDVSVIVCAGIPSLYSLIPDDLINKD